jgi:hypothetical protein
MACNGGGVDLGIGEETGGAEVELATAGEIMTDGGIPGNLDGLTDADDLEVVLAEGADVNAQADAIEGELSAWDILLVGADWQSQCV